MQHMLEVMRGRFSDAARERGGEAWQDLAITLNASIWIGKFLEVFKPMRLLELGSGFSTLVLRRYLPKAATMISADHDGAWQEFVRQQLAERMPEDVVTFESLKDARGALPVKFDLVFVDHGPTMETRIRDLPWVMTLADVLICDDWRQGARGAFTRRMTAQLEMAGWKLDVLDETRSSPGGRTLCLARRVST